MELPAAGLLVLAGATIVCAAQTPNSPPEISGVVREAGTLLPVADVRITASQSIAITAADGSFHLPLKMGSYTVAASKDGWTSTPTQTVFLSGEHPRRQIDFLLAQMAQATGTIIDSETRKPIPDVTVLAWRVAYREGVRSMESGGQSKPTDSEGRFEIASLMPGDYLFQVRPHIQGSQRLLKKFEAKDREQVDEDVDSAYLPGNTNFESSLPITIPSGARFNLGAIAAKRTQLYRIEAVANAGPCRDGETVIIGVRAASQRAQEFLGDVACGSKFLITGFARGSYLLTASLNRPDGRLTGVAPFEIRSEAAEAAVSLVPGVDLAIRAALSQDAHSPFPKDLLLRLAPIAGSPAPVVNALLNGQRDLHVKSLNSADYRITVSDLSAAYCLKEIRQNGSVVPDNILRLSDSAMPGLLEIELNDKPGVIVGAVTADDRPLANPYVVAVRWPFSGSIYTSVTRAAGDADGNFQIPSLAAGTYRVAAIRGEAKDKLEEPGAMEAFLAHGESVTIDSGSLHRVSLKAADSLR